MRTSPHQRGTSGSLVGDQNSIPAYQSGGNSNVNGVWLGTWTSTLTSLSPTQAVSEEAVKLEELDRVRIILNVQYLFQGPKRSKLNNKKQTIDAKTKMTKTLEFSEKEYKTDIPEIIWEVLNMFKQNEEKKSLWKEIKKIKMSQMEIWKTQ